MMRNLSIQGSVGKAGTNNANDVKVIRALLNVYFRKNKKPILLINNKSDTALEQSIYNFQIDVIKTTTPDSKVDPKGKTFSALSATLKAVFQPISYKQPSFGLVTWNAEGNEGGIYHSRKLHIPSRFSGLTIGRGYDCSQKSVGKISADLAKAGLAANKVSILKQAAGLTGARAKHFVIDNDLLDYQITHSMQHELFKISYNDELAVIKSLSGKAANIRQYGKVDWINLHPSIRDVVVDLKYRGDYIPSTRAFIQSPIASNDLATFKKLIQDKTKWTNVPPDRFKRRSDFIAKAKVINKKPAIPTP